MKTFQNQSAQGDILLLRVDAIPEGARRQAPIDGRHVVAHGETGHHHTVPAIAELWRLPDDPMMRFRSCCEEAGIEVIEVSAAYHSQRCPACGATDPSHRDLRRWLLRCGSCSFRRDLDVAAALNALERGEAKREGRPSAFDELPKPKRKRGGARRSPRSKQKGAT
jgi:hypothetical protein